ncbi:HAMP domain-containing sensor histidine kinase [Xanthomonas sp. NCPPB 2654]|uniref:sensor histidine kinase n=1 Tax=unclassified Xanthomonas TaxID=2643310 RepID=UPI0021DFD2E9|nr:MULTISPECIES: HAMP domain-containing sensor histidine kinase [unclassified Xanthomonas]MDL5366817.1 HAMP domain-containing sensor histidine kinase [Xanthomonas sp. NCPPB 2654]UYC20089.1 HAMP domain-containing histidine kinase [Xanthomonas sp. CFBP 8443]
MPRSLLRQLLLIWIVILAACVGMAVVLFGLYRHSEGVRVGEAQARLQGDCTRIVQRYNGASAAARGSDGAGLAAVVLQLVLADAAGVEGGVWERQRGFLAYAYPTYDGSEHKTDVPTAEQNVIVATAQRSVADRQPAHYRRDGQRETLLIAACPLDRDSAAWTMTRVAATGEASAGRPLAVGMALILALAVVSAVALGWVVRRWSQRLQRIQQALATPAEVPSIPATGAPELDRLGAAVTDYAQRSAQALAEARRLGEELSRHERLAALGRMTATVAHEIRNPIATLRLALENQIAAGEGGFDEAQAQLMLAQIQRLDGVVESLLGMVQPIRLQRQTVALQAWLQDLLDPAEWAPLAAPIALQLAAAPAQWTLDPQQAARALHNLLRNALQHATPGTAVTLMVEADADLLRLTVANRGEPVPAPVAAHLFEPFASGRSDGNGLGLALVREIARAHGGQAHYAHHDGITSFILELPWRAS